MESAMTLADCPGNDRRHLPDRTYVSLTEAVTWLLYGECLDDDAIDQRRRERATGDREEWWDHNGPAWLKPHLELLAKGQRWQFTPDASQDNIEVTLRALAAAERWLAETGRDTEAAYARVCAELSKRESCGRDGQRHLDRLY
jgi:hypothetical protein